MTSLATRSGRRTACISGTRPPQDAPTNVTAEAPALSRTASTSLAWDWVAKHFFEETVALSQLKRISVGSDPGNDVVLNYPMISRHHLKIYQSGTNVIVEDRRFGLLQCLTPWKGDLQPDTLPGRSETA